MAQANIKAVITAEDRASAVLGTFGNNVESTANKIGSAMKIAAAAAVGLAVAGIGAAAKASWDQVDAVQQATVGLRAYEKDASKVNSTLSDLLKYARSDLGVLFNRRDLFESAQSLKIMGDNTDSLVGHVKILSRSVGLGLSNWQDLNLIVGRVGSTGRLTGEDFDNLTKAGFKLDSSLRNTDITFASLFEQLDKGIPADALAGQADTIKGKMIRLETAFRGVGDAILGVDSDTGKFIEGGLGDRLVGVMDKLREIMSDPALKQGLRDLVKGLLGLFDGIDFGAIWKSLQEVGSTITKFLKPAIDFVVENRKDFVQFFINFGIALAVLIPLLGTFSILLTSIDWPLLLVAGLIGGIILLEQRTGFLTKAWQFFKPVIDDTVAAIQIAYSWFVKYILPVLQQIGGYILGQLSQAWNSLINSIMDVSKQLEPFISKADQLKIVLGLLLLPLALLVTAIIVFVGVVAIVVAAIATMINWIIQAESAYSKFATGVAISIGQFVNSVGNGLGQAIAWFAGLNGKVLQALGNAGMWLFNTGRDIVYGLVNGIKSVAGEIGSALTNASNDAVKKVKNVLGIHSPSTVFAGIGENIGQGMVQGIESTMPSVMGAMDNLTPNIATGTMSQSALGSRTTVTQNNPAPNITIQVGAFMGTQTDARKLAKMVFESYQEIQTMGGTA